MLYIYRFFAMPLFTGPLLMPCLLMNRRNDLQDRQIIGMIRNHELDRYTQIQANFILFFQKKSKNLKSLQAFTNFTFPNLAFRVAQE